MSPATRRLDLERFPPSDGTGNHTTTNNHDDDKSSVVISLEGEENQLSQDLALFLANPSLRTALADGSLDLKSYSATVRGELESLERDCIAVYTRLNADEKLTSILSRDISTCRTVLAQLHEMLRGFDADVGGLSGELRHWQTASRELDGQLRQGRAGADVLSQFLEHVVVAPSIATMIQSGPVNSSAFGAAVLELQRVHANCRREDPATTPWSRGIPVSETPSAGTEQSQLTTALMHVAIQRSRAYLLEQMALLRRPQTNVRLIQVHGMLAHGAVLYDFLEDCDESKKIAPELFAVYIESMSFTIKQLFRTYSQQLLLLDATRSACTRTDVIAIDEAVLRESVAAHQTAIVTARQNKTSLPPRVDPFALGQRAVDCVVSGASAPIAVQVAMLQKELYPFERLWGSLLGHLLDAVTNEHVFCRQFFKRDAFASLFGGTLSLLTEQLENYLFTCYDAICLLLLIKVTHTVRSEARRRTITALDSFLDQVTYLLWPRLKTVMDGHVRSLRQATALSLGLVSTSSSSSSSTLLSPGGQTAQPSMNTHYVSRRCGEFCCSILLILQDTTHDASSNDAPNDTATRNSLTPTGKVSISSGDLGEENKGSIVYNSGSLKRSSASKSHGGGGDEAKSAGGKLLQDVSEMMDAFVQLMERLAEDHSTQKKRSVFLINNLDVVVSIFQERRVSGQECTKLLELLMKYRENFVEEELLTGFSKMIAFIQQTEAHMASVRGRGGGGGSAPADFDVNSSVVESLVLDFASHWKAHIDQINRNVLSYFSNFRNGMEILKHCLTQLLLYYTRFQEIIRKVWKKPAPFAKDLVSTNVILAEIKKYALAI